MSARKVVITGMGVLSPVGNDVAQMWESMTAGRGGIGSITAFDATPFTSRVAGEVKDFDPGKYLDRKAVKRMDLFCQYGLSAAVQAVRDSGLDPAKEDLTRIGVYASSGVGGIKTIEEQYKIMLEKGPDRVSPLLVPMMIINLLPGHIAMTFGFKGPNLSVVSACATGAHCVGEAMRAIRHGYCDVMVTGGAEASISPLGIAGFCTMRALTTRNDEPEKACRPFDKDRDGFIMAEGAAMLVLEEYEHARARGARIYAELAGYGASCDAYHLTAPAPEGAGAAQCMAAAIADAGMNPSDIGYVNAHGTSTPLNDKFETMAVKTVFGENARRVSVSSTKSMTGHMLGAAGSIEVMVAALAVRDGVLPPTINYTTPDPECDLDYVPNQARKVSIGAAISNSFGFGGHNATVAVKKI